MQSRGRIQPQFRSRHAYILPRKLTSCTGEEVEKRRLDINNERHKVFQPWPQLEREETKKAKCRTPGWHEHHRVHMRNTFLQMPDFLKDAQISSMT